MVTLASTALIAQYFDKRRGLAMGIVNIAGSFGGKDYYSLCQKKRTFNLEFFCGPPPPGRSQKNSGLNVRFFWHRLYIQ